MVLGMVALVVNQMPLFSHLKAKGSSVMWNTESDTLESLSTNNEIIPNFSDKSNN